MNLAQQRRLIAVSAMLVFALGFLSHVRKGQLPTARFMIGTGGIYTIISIFADLGLAIGAGMSMVVLLTAILTEGGPVIELLNTRAGISTPKERKGGGVAQRLAPGVKQVLHFKNRKEAEEALTHVPSLQAPQAKPKPKPAPPTGPLYFP